MSFPDAQMPQSVPDTPAASARRVIELGRLAAVAYERSDLAEILATAIGRVDRPETLIAIMGEFKKGKSSLINALLGADIAPVDDDLATAVTTLYRHGDEPGALVLAVDDGKDTQYTTSTEEALSLASEKQNPGNERRIRAIEVRFQNGLLETGAILVDTPGFGGLALRGAGVPLSLLRAVDAVVMVSDASTPLLRPELEVLTKAAEVCPAILLALSKTDLYPDWRVILAYDETALAEASLDVPVLPVSSVLMRHAQRSEDKKLADQSGVPALHELLLGLVLDRGRTDACRRGLDDTRAVVGQLQQSAQAALGALENPEDAAAHVIELAAARERLEHLRGPGARWSQVMTDAFTDATGEADHQFRQAMRDLNREIDEDIEHMDPSRSWDSLAEKIRSRVAAAVDRLFEQTDAGGRDAERAVREWLRTNEGLDISAGQSVSLAAIAEWTPRPVENLSYAKQAETLWSAVRGGQGGIFTIGMIASVAGITLATAATAGIGLVFGGKQILDERSRQLQARRQQARTIARQFIDDVQFEANKRVRDLARDLQRQLRDGFLQLVATQHQTCADSLAAVQAAMQQDATTRTQRIARIQARLDNLQTIEGRIAAVEASL